MKYRNATKLSLIAILVSTAMHANAGITVIDNEKGSFSIGGDVEFDFNYMNFDSTSEDWQFDQTGRILLNFAGERVTDDNNYLKMQVSPTYNQSGSIGLDDAWFAFGKQKGPEIRIGRFESYDMFPLGQDTFIDHSGDTSDGLISDSGAYIYRAKEARGRSTDGQIMYSQTFNQLYFELNALLGDRSSLFGSTYHGKTVESGDDAFVIRPVIAYTQDSFTIAASVERNLSSDAVTANGVDIMERTGYGLRTSYNINDINIHANFAYMDAVDETNATAGINVLYKGFGLGYVYARNEYTNEQFSGWYEGDVDVSTIYTSYHFTNVMDVEDFSIYTGAFQSKAEEKNVKSGAGTYANGDNDIGLRVRFKYIF
ncbi:porin [Vibrio diazotrophicus]|nr:porin [Vibrio diazotrophicus]